MEQIQSGQQERRYVKRFSAIDNALVFMGMDTGTLVNIGMGGMAVHFVAFDQAVPFMHHLDIFHAGSRFLIRDVPVALVREVEVAPKSVFSILRIRRLCMRFGVLSLQQQVLLKGFITEIGSACQS